MKRIYHTAIYEFRVIKPELNEIKNESLYLSSFGEYCPKKSLRGYTLTFLLKHPDRYKPYSVVEKGELKIIEYHVF